MSNEKTTEQLIREYELVMPPEIMDMIKTFDWKRELRMIVNQNQIMIDVAADLEQSVYLMLLGVVQVADVYEKLIDVHEFSEDKSKKVLEEIENNIFNPLFKKLAALDDAEPHESITTQAQYSKDPEDRKAILAEIEKEEPTLIVKPTIVKPVISTPINEIKINPSFSSQKPPIESVQNPGIAQSFSLNSQKQTIEPIKIVPPEVVKGIQSDPISSGLNKATVMSTPPTNVPIAPVRTPGAPDPYREPIE